MTKWIQKSIISAIFVLLPFALRAQGLVINEIMQGNIDFILEANEFPDSWVELYNSSEDDINLNGYGLGLKKKDAYFFDFDTIVPSQTFVVLYCDKEAYGLHTDFRLDAGSGSIYLIGPDGTVADELSHKKQLAPNIAYGRVSDGAKEWGHQLRPTPGMTNEGGISSVLLPQPEFTSPAGLYQQGFVLTVSIPDIESLPEDVRLCVTTDGREPTLADAVVSVKTDRPTTGGDDNEDPTEGVDNNPQENGDNRQPTIRVVDNVDLCGNGEDNQPEENGENEEPSEVTYLREWSMNIDASIVVRAKLISAQAHSPRAATYSYIFHPRDTELAVISIATNPEYLYDDEIGIFAGVLGENPNFEKDLRRPVNIEYFDADNGYFSTVNQVGEIKIHGNWSTRYPQKSFNVYAQKRFGTKRFDTKNFWPDKPDVVECKSFVMRNGGSDCESARVRDQLSQTLIGRNVPGTDWAANREVICYINGEYKGVYDLRERTNEDYIAANYNGLEDIDFVDSWDEIKSGDLDAYTDCLAPAGALSTFEELCEWTDIDQFINMYVLEAFVGNTDFIYNNIACWRTWDGDGRWHWMLEDLDRSAVSWLEVDSDYFDFVRSFRSEESNQWEREISNIFNLILDTAEGRELLAERIAVAMGDWLQYDYMTEVLEELCQQIEPEYIHSLEVYYPESYQHRYEVWQDQIAHIRQWWPKRMDYVYNQMVPNNCGINPQTYSLEVDPHGNALKLNGMDVYRPCFKGRYFNSRGMTLSTVGSHSGWRVEITRQDGSVQQMYIAEDEYTLQADDSYDRVIVDVVDTTGLENLIPSYSQNNYLTNNGKKEYFNLQGIRVPSPQKGQLVIEKTGGDIHKIIF